MTETSIKSAYTELMAAANNLQMSGHYLQQEINNHHPHYKTHSITVQNYTGMEIFTQHAWKL